MNRPLRITRLRPSPEQWLVLGFYFVFAAFYYAALRWSSYNPPEDNYYRWQIVVDYGLKGLLTLPVWWLLLRALAHWPFWQRLGLHLLLLPLWVKGWQQLYYYCCEELGMGHLGGRAEWWDIYIPALFYTLQFGIFHAYEYYQRLREAKELEHALHESVLQSELTALKAQLNPHFLYNAFNAISASVPSEQEYTRELIATLADMFRYQLWASKVEVVPFKVEVDFVKRYLELEKARFGDRLTVAYDIDANAEDFPVPPMLLQPLVENAVRHGISPLVDGGQIRITARREATGLALQIADTGVGFDTAAFENGQGIGLRNTRRRLELAFGAPVEIRENVPQGTHISFTIPYQPHVTESSDRG